MTAAVVVVAVIAAGVSAAVRMMAVFFGFRLRECSDDPEDKADGNEGVNKEFHNGVDQRYLSVTAPSLALVTSLAYFARTPYL